MAKQFWKQLKLKYRLTIHNENKLENVLGFYISPIGVIISMVISLILVLGVVYLILMYTPVKQYLPGYINDKVREKIVNDALRVDSLGEEVEKQDKYISNIKNIILGKISDKEIVSDTMPLIGDFPTEISEREATYTREFEEREKYNLTSQAATVGALQELIMFRPARGLIIKEYNPGLKHFGVDIVENPNESVLAILDGTVIMSDFTSADGYTLIVQHKQNLTSVYKNCYRPLKEVGDKVTAGEVIATLSGELNEGEGKSKPYLHFELWHRGESLDPTMYIAF